MDAAIIALVGLGLNLAVLIVVGTWQLSRIEARWMKVLTTQREEGDTRREQDRKEAGRAREETERRLGESLAAIREKVSDFEKWTRDTFIRRDSFYKVIDMLTSEVKAYKTVTEARMDRMEGSVNQRFDRLDEKMDRMLGLPLQPPPPVRGTGP